MASMSFLGGTRKRVLSVGSLPTPNSTKTTKSSNEKITAQVGQKLGFFRRRVNIRGSSKISVPLYIVLLFPTIILITILILVLRHPDSPASLLMPTGSPPGVRRISEKHDKVFVTGCLDPATQVNEPRVNGAFVVLARNKELPGVIDSLKSVERHFNRWFHYPYVFLNNEDFNSTFKETVMNYTSAPVEFGKISPEHWGFPDWMDAKVAKEGIAKQGDQAIMYGGMESYHHMCRFYSGFFYKHELLQKYDWYWRVEPDIKYYCDLTYDPFRYMVNNNKTYGFTIAVKELKETVPNIWRYASAYRRMNNLTSQGLWEMFVEPKPEDLKKKNTPAKDLPKDDPKHAKDNQKPLPEDIQRTDLRDSTLPEIDADAMEGETYNMCHFWSNFEIARLDFFRSPEYEAFFQMMDRSGGFWMERVSSWSEYILRQLLTPDFSGETLPYTPSLPEPCLPLPTSTTSEILATGTQPYITVLSMHHTDSSVTSLTEAPSTSNRCKRSIVTSPKLLTRKTRIGRSGTPRKRTVLAAAANVIQTLSMSRTRRAAVYLNGWKLLEAISRLMDPGSLESYKPESSILDMCSSVAHFDTATRTRSIDQQALFDWELRRPSQNSKNVTHHAEIHIHVLSTLLPLVHSSAPPSSSSASISSPVSTIEYKLQNHFIILILLDSNHAFPSS